MKLKSVLAWMLCFGMLFTGNTVSVNAETAQQQEEASEEGQTSEFYSSLFRHLSMREEKFTVAYGDTDLLDFNDNGIDIEEDCMELIDRACSIGDDSYLRWICRSCKVKDNSRKKKLKFAVEYAETLEETQDGDIWIEKKLKELGVTDAKYTEVDGETTISEYEDDKYAKAENIRKIHDYILDRMNYDDTVTEYTIKNMANGTDRDSDSLGYSLVAYRMFKAAGIECEIVKGTYKNEPHIWNMVELGTEWYSIDLALDDSEKSAFGNSRYYLKGSSGMKETHTLDGEYTDSEWKEAHKVSDMSYAEDSVFEAIALLIVGLISWVIGLVR